MSRGLRGAAAVLSWPLLLAAVLTHGVLAALAAAEYARVGWLLHFPYDLAAVSLVLVSAMAGLASAALVAARAVRGSVVLRRMGRSGSPQFPAAARDTAAAQDTAAALGIAGRVRVVASDEAFAVTCGLLRPRILVSEGLARSLSRAELMAVLAHERCHLQHRDPLRLLAARMLAGYGFYLPAARWLAGQLGLRRELAADRAAATRAGRAVLAGALLKLASVPACPAVAAAGHADDPAGSLEARVTQLEHGRPARPRLGRTRIAATAGGMALLTAAGMCCAALSQVIPGGVA
ncbi:MAG TPA: M56 family metallopeptidase [Streptosporangiaceae bacterium]|nr:M56 family metallopeptidase [Streptosporangiaceae bacterium]